jgi:AbrB family looped-hinge helix DNA binding protein
MEKITVTPEFEVVIPSSILKHLRVQPGQQLQVIASDGRLELIPLRRADELRGFLAHLQNDFRREPDRLP